MAERGIVKTIRGQRAVDGAGVHMVRVLTPRDVYDFDPFLMLDSFDSTNPADYVAGFPTHPHRGIETITYLIEGQIDHEDSLGNKGSVRNGESQWMTAGSGILHQEMPQACPRMLGFQLWLNLSKADKMTDPAYFDITNDKVGVASRDGAEVRILAGSFDGVSGVKAPHVPVELYDITLAPGAALTVPTEASHKVFVFLIEGDAIVGGQAQPAKTAVLFSEGDSITLAAPAGKEARVIFFSGEPLEEPIAWGGPIVMNTDAELHEAFSEIRRGTFIKHR